jgi:RNA polymerase sigma-70 factor (ECF subfamily)
MSTAAELPDPAAALAFDDALRRAAPRLRRYAHRRLGDAHEAEEVVQEALLRACQHAPGFATDDDLLAWTTVVTGHLVIDRLRLRNRSVSVAEVPEHTRVGRDTADVVVARDEARAALDALEAMPSRQAAVLWAREVEGLSYGDISERFDLSEPTVRSLLHRARRTLRKEYAARGGTLPVAGIAVLAPWRDGLHGLARLRSAARQALAPVAAGAAAISILGVTTLFVGPGGGAPVRHPAIQLAPSQSAAAQLARPTSTGGAVAAGHTGAAASTVAAAASHGGSGHATPVVRPVCAGTAKNGASRGQVGINCTAPDPSTPVLVVAVPLPNNPTKLTYVGVTSDKVDCSKVPNLRIARCAPQQDPSTSVRSK